MKLFLSSLRIPNLDEQKKLFGKKDDISVVIVPNAWDPYAEGRRNSEIAETIAEFEALGYITSVLDLVKSTEAQRKEALETNDFLWVTGGNTFYLNYLVKKTGFDVLIKDALTRTLVYGGASAGAIITGPTLHGAEYADDPNDAPEVIWDAMKLVDFSIVPHWGTDKYLPVLQKIQATQMQYVANVITLTNDQALTLINDKFNVQ
jgi:dipeptidase E